MQNKPPIAARAQTLTQNQHILPRAIQALAGQTLRRADLGQAQAIQARAGIGPEGLWRALGGRWDWVTLKQGDGPQQHKHGHRGPAEGLQKEAAPGAPARRTGKGQGWRASTRAMFKDSTHPPILPQDGHLVGDCLDSPLKKDEKPVLAVLCSRKRLGLAQ
jgi:hypothetical protein